MTWWRCWGGLTTYLLTKGDYQEPVRDEDHDKTVFTSQFGKFMVRTLPFGLKETPATFQRLMDNVLDRMSKYCAAYLDDRAVFSDNWDSHIIHLRRILQQLRDKGLTVKIWKCQLRMSSCRYLGQKVGQRRQR